MIKIVKGNDALLKFPFFEKRDSEIVALPTTEFEGLEIKIFNKASETTVSQEQITLSENNITVLIPCTTDIGVYNVSISALLDNAHFRSVFKDAFSIVNYNSEATYNTATSPEENVIEGAYVTRISIDQHGTTQSNETDETEENNG